MPKGDYKKEPFYKVLEWCRLTMTELSRHMNLSRQNISQRIRKDDLKLSLFEAVASASKRDVIEVLKMYYDAKKLETTNEQPTTN